MLFGFTPEETGKVHAVYPFIRISILNKLKKNMYDIHVYM